MPDEKRADSGKDGEKLDKVLSHLDSIMKRQDEDRSRLDALCGRMDSYDEEKKADKARKDAEEAAMADKARKDAEEAEGKKKEAEAEEQRKADKARKDAEEAEQAEEAKKRADAGTVPSPEILKTIAELQSRIPVELSEQERPQFVSAQVKAERVYQAFGDSAGAPRWLNGEQLPQYRRRLLNKVKQHSTAWKDVELETLIGAALDVAEKQIYADAMTAVNSPAGVEPGQLRTVMRQDETGRQSREFYGDPEAVWGPFKAPVRAVTGWTTKFN